MKISKQLDLLQKSSVKTITIISPYKLGQGETDLFLKHLPFVSGKDIKIESFVDCSLIAGLVVIYQSKVIDLSLKKRLEDLRKDLSDN